MKKYIMHSIIIVEAENADEAEKLVYDHEITSKLSDCNNIEIIKEIG